MGEGPLTEQFLPRCANTVKHQSQKKDTVFMAAHRNAEIIAGRQCIGLGTVAFSIHLLEISGFVSTSSEANELGVETSL